MPESAFFESTATHRADMESSQDSIIEEGQEIHLRNYLRILWKRRKVVYTFSGASVCIALLVTLTATPEYLAATKILVEKEADNPLGNGQYYVQEEPEFLATQNEIITSKRVALKAVRLLNLESEYRNYFPKAADQTSFIDRLTSPLSNLLLAIKEKFRSGDTTQSLAQELDTNTAEEYSEFEKDLAGMLQGGVRVTPIKQSKILELSYMSENPIFSKRAANALAKAYTDELLEMKMSASAYAINWMTGKVNEEREKLSKSEQALQQFKKNNNIVTVDDRVAITPQKLVEFGTQLSQAEAKRQALEATYEQVRQGTLEGESAIDSLPAIAGSGAIQALRTQIIEADRKVAELSKKYGPKHPLMIKAQGERSLLLAKKNQETKRAIDSIRNDFELAKANEDNLRNVLASTKAETIGVNERFSEYEILKKEVDSNRTVYEALVARLKEQDITEKAKNINVWIVAEATVPGTPATPNKKKNLLQGIIFGLLGGIGLAFFIEYLDNTVKVPEEVEERFGLPLLGVIGKFAGEGADGQMEAKLACLSPKHSIIAENYKALRTSILLSSSGSPPASIVVTSMLPAEGKSNTAANLALTLAQTGKRILLVDGDMRKPTLHTLFNLDNQKGLSSFLAGATGLDIFQAGPLDTLQIITSGPLPPNPSELLSSPQLSLLLEKAKSNFDMVVFDSPPAVSVTDSMVLSAVVDGMVLVVRSGMTTYEVVQKGLRMLADIQARVLGIVLNDYDIRDSHYYYGKYYQQSYGNYVKSE